jgi:hypothetical protein
MRTTLNNPSNSTNKHPAPNPQQAHPVFFAAQLSLEAVPVQDTLQEVGTGPAEAGTDPVEVGTDPVEVSTGPLEVDTGPVEVDTDPVEVDIDLVLFWVRCKEVRTILLLGRIVWRVG